MCETPRTDCVKVRKKVYNVNRCKHFFLMYSQGDIYGKPTAVCLLTLKAMSLGRLFTCASFPTGNKLCKISNKYVRNMLVSD